MRILIVNYMETTAPGGINKVVYEIAKNLSKRCHEVIVLQANPLNLPNEEINEGFKIIRIKSFIDLYGFSPCVYFYLRKHLKELKPEIIHLHGYHSLFSFVTIYAVKKFSSMTRIIFSAHLDIFRCSFAGKYLWNFYNNIIGKKLFNSVDLIISPSRFEAETIQKLFGIQKDKIKIIPHGVEIIDYKKPEKNDIIDLLYAGYLIERKGVQYILESLSFLVNAMNIKNIKLTVIGEGPERKKLINLAEKFSLNEYILWKKFVPQKNLIDEIKKADILMLLSESEAYGIIVAEALALGTPVIVTKRTALEEFLDEPGCFGVNYPPDPKEVAKLILEIVNSNVKVGPFSKKIRTWEEVAKDYEEIYEEVLSLNNFNC